MGSDPVSDPRIVPHPPRLHWGIVLALQIVTVGFFGLAWLLVQAIWVRKITRKKAGFIWALVSLCAVPALILLAFGFGLVLAFTGHAAEAREATRTLEAGYRLVFLVLYFATVSTLRSEMITFPIKMPLSRTMTWLFGAIYFQYNLSDYVLPEAIDVYGPFPDAPAYVPPT